MEEKHIEQSNNNISTPTHIYGNPYTDKEKQYLKTDKSYILQIAAMPLPAGQ